MNTINENKNVSLVAKRCSSFNPDSANKIIEK